MKVSTMRAPVTILLLLSLVACGASQRERTIKATLATVNASRDAFVAFDRATQDTIVATAPSFERGADLLRSYRDKREPVVAGFTAAYRAIAIAATVEDDHTVAAMIAAAQQIVDAFKKLKEDISP